MTRDEHIRQKINPNYFGARIVDKLDLHPKGFSAKELDTHYYKLTASRYENAKLLEPVGFDDVDAYYNPGDDPVSPDFILEAVTIQRFSRTEKRMAAVVRVLNKHLKSGENGLFAQTPLVGNPRKSGGFAYVTVQIPFSDGQVVSIVFHSPEGDAKKIGPEDSLIAFRWLLNKRDITHVVAPESGKEVSLEEIGKRLTQLVDKNHNRFVATQKQAVEETRKLEELSKQVESLESESQELSVQVVDASKHEEAVESKLKTVKDKVEGQRKRNAELEAEITALQAMIKAKSVGGEAGASDPTPQEEEGVKPTDEPTPEPFKSAPKADPAKPVLSTFTSDPMDAENIAADGGYQAVVEDKELSEKWQDALDHALNKRVVEVRNALRDLGWEGEQYKDLSKNGVVAKFEYKQVGAGMNIVGYSINDIQDDMTASSADFAKKVDTAVGQSTEADNGLSMEQKIEKASQLGAAALGKYTAPAQDPEAMKLLEGIAMGEGAPILDAWNKAFHEANAAQPVVVFELPKTDSRPEALRVELDKESGLFLVQTSKDGKSWVTQKDFASKEDAIADAKGWYPEPGPQNADPDADAYAIGETFWFKGDEYEAMSEPYEDLGAMWQNAKRLSDGKQIMVPTKGQSKTNAQAKQDEWQEQQDEFRKLNGSDPEAEPSEQKEITSYMQRGIDLLLEAKEKLSNVSSRDEERELIKLGNQIYDEMVDINQATGNKVSNSLERAASSAFWFSRNPGKEDVLGESYIKDAFKAIEQALAAYSKKVGFDVSQMTASAPDAKSGYTTPEAVQTLQSIIDGDYDNNPAELDTKLDEAADELEAAGLMDEYEDLLNQAADKAAAIAIEAAKGVA